MRSSCIFFVSFGAKAHPIEHQVIIKYFVIGDFFLFRELFELPGLQGQTCGDPDLGDGHRLYRVFGVIDGYRHPNGFTHMGLCIADGGMQEQIGLFAVGWCECMVRNFQIIGDALFFIRVLDGNSVLSGMQERCDTYRRVKGCGHL